MISAMPQTAQDATEQLLDRIATVDVQTNAVCTLHPDALAQAAQRDREASEGRPRGPLHGRAGPGEGQHRHRRPAHDGRVAGPRRRRRPGPGRRCWSQRLRDAGMVVLGKTNLSEWANIRDDGTRPPGGAGTAA